MRIADFSLILASSANLSVNLELNIGEDLFIYISST